MYQTMIMEQKVDYTMLLMGQMYQTMIMEQKVDYTMLLMGKTAVHTVLLVGQAEAHTMLLSNMMLLVGQAQEVPCAFIHLALMWPDSRL